MMHKLQKQKQRRILHTTQVLPSSIAPVLHRQFGFDKVCFL